MGRLPVVHTPGSFVLDAGRVNAGLLWVPSRPVKGCSCRQGTALGARWHRESSLSWAGPPSAEPWPRGLSPASRWAAVLPSGWWTVAVSCPRWPQDLCWLPRAPLFQEPVPELVRQDREDGTCSSFCTVSSIPASLHQPDRRVLDAEHTAQHLLGMLAGAGMAVTSSASTLGGPGRWCGLGEGDCLGGQPWTAGEGRLGQQLSLSWPPWWPLGVWIGLAAAQAQSPFLTVNLLMYLFWFWSFVEP